MSFSERAKTILNEVFKNIYQATVEDDDFYSVTQLLKFKNVYFIKLKHECPLAKQCVIAGRSHTGVPKRSYCVNISTGRVSTICCSSKCKKISGGEKMLTHEENTSDDEE
jgi:hypothetical protein